MSFGVAFEPCLLAAQAGAAWATERLYRDLAPVVTGWIRSQGVVEADDVASETFLSAFKAIDSFEGGEEQFRSWVFAIAYRRVQDHWRSRARRPHADRQIEESDLPKTGGADEPVVARDDALVRELLEGLTDEQADVVSLRIIAGLSVTETALTLGKTEDSVRALQHRAMKQIRSAYELDGAAGAVRTDAECASHAACRKR